MSFDGFWWDLMELNEIRCD